MKDDEYDDDQKLRLPDDYTDNEEVSDMTDLEVGGVVMADFGLDIGDDFDTETTAEGSASTGTGQKGERVRRAARKPKSNRGVKTAKAARTGRVRKKSGKPVARKKASGRAKTTPVRKVKRKAAAKTRRKTSKKTRRAPTKETGVRKAARKVGSKK